MGWWVRICMGVEVILGLVVEGVGWWVGWGRGEGEVGGGGGGV